MFFFCSFFTIFSVDFSMIFYGYFFVLPFTIWICQQPDNTVYLAMIRYRSSIVTTRLIFISINYRYGVVCFILLFGFRSFLPSVGNMFRKSFIDFFFSQLSSHVDDMSKVPHLHRVPWWCDCTLFFFLVRNAYTLNM